MTQKIKQATPEQIVAFLHGMRGQAMSDPRIEDLLAEIERLKRAEIAWHLAEAENKRLQAHAISMINAMKVDYALLSDDYKQLQIDNEKLQFKIEHLQDELKDERAADDRA